MNGTSTNPDILTAIFKNILEAFGLSGVAEKAESGVPYITESAKFLAIHFLAKFSVFSAFFSFAMVILVAIYIYKFQTTRTQFVDKVSPKGKGKRTIVESEVNPKWEIVMGHVNSADPHRWKFAILEADIMLDELLDKLNLPGDNIGEKLKAVEPSDFFTIEDAWEAHKIRNAIAHEGSEFLINQREALRVVGLYGKVFKEFKII